MSTGSGQQSGWYYAQGDPPGTHRYWDGAQWVGGPQPVAAAGAPGYMPGSTPGLAYGDMSSGRPLAGPGIRILARLLDGAILFAAALIIKPALEQVTWLAVGTHRPATLAVREVAGLVRHILTRPDSKARDRPRD